MQKLKTSINSIFTPGSIACLSAAILVSLATLVSLVYVGGADKANARPDYWQKLSEQKKQFAPLEAEIASGKLPSDKKQARALAQIYRQEGKMREAANVYRLLWSASTASARPAPDFIADARELASIYSDMGAADSAVSSYQKILQFDQEQKPISHKQLACDYNNLGQSYYTAASCTPEPKQREQYLNWSGEQFAQAETEQKLAENSGSNSPEFKSDRSVVKINKMLLEMDLHPAPGQAKNMLTAINSFGQ